MQETTIKFPEQEGKNRPPQPPKKFGAPGTIKEKRQRRRRKREKKVKVKEPASV